MRGSATSWLQLSWAGNLFLTPEWNVNNPPSWIENGYDNRIDSY